MSAAISEFSTDPVETSRLSQLPVFKGANLTALKPVLTQCPLLQLKQDEILVDPGQPLPVAYQLISGKLASFSERGERLSEIVPGEFVGAIETFAHTPAANQIRATEDCSLLVLDEGGLMGMVNCSHTVARNALYMFMEHVRYQDLPAANDDARAGLRARYARTSHIDDVTGLHNHLWFKEMLTRQIMRSATESKPLTVLMLAIDSYEEFRNDFGQVASDHAECVVADVIRQSARPTDMYGVMQHNEFVIALPDTNIEGGTVVAERLRTTIADSAVVIPGECLLPPVTVSIGLVQMTAFVADEKLLSDSRAALQQARDAGGNQVVR